MADLDAWYDRARADWQEADRIADGLDGIRDAIFGLWLLVADAASNFRDLYRGIDEVGLVHEAQAAASAGSLPALPPSCTTGGDRDLFMRTLAVGLRALELRLSALSDGGTIRRPSQCLATFGGSQAYVVRVPARHRQAATGHSFRRRALLGLRVLPLVVLDYNVRVRFTEDPLRRNANGLAGLPMGASLFPQVEFDIEDTAAGFRVRSATSDNHLDHIETAVKAADEANCFALTLPELTVDGATLATVRGLMADGTWEVMNLGILVAGSRHADVGDGDVVNVATVLDRYGAEVAEHCKLFRYNEGPGPHEDIALGNTIEVLVTEDAVIAFGICLDFCNHAEPSPYPWLDVDYVLVPSCGGVSTMRGHLDRSNEILRTMKARSLVVQQHYGKARTETPPVGYVLAREDGDPPEIESLDTNDTWILVHL